MLCYSALVNRASRDLASLVRASRGCPVISLLCRWLQIRVVHFDKVQGTISFEHSVVCHAFRISWMAPLLKVSASYRLNNGGSSQMDGSVVVVVKEVRHWKVCPLSGSSLGYRQQHRSRAIMGSSWLRLSCPMLRTSDSAVALCYEGILPSLEVWRSSSVPAVDYSHMVVLEAIN